MVYFFDQLFCWSVFETGSENSVLVKLLKKNQEQRRGIFSVHFIFGEGARKACVKSFCKVSKIF